MRSALFALFFFVLQGPPAQPPGSIEGYVLKTGTSTPVSRARVDVRRDGGGSAGALVTTTDASGKFTIRNVPPGRYRVSASRDGYVPSQFGERSRGGPGAVITLEFRQELKDIVLALTPKGAISGRIYDRFGDPVVNANVQAMKHTYQDGRRILVPVDNARTNDLGEYRLFWLTPGQYIISAVPLESPCVDGCGVIVQGGVSGPPQIIGGAVRLDARVAVPAPDIPETYLPVYFPGTTDASTASLVDLPGGVNLTGVDLKIAETRAVRVRGRVINGLTGQPALGATIALVPRRGTVATGSSQRASVANTGAFEFRHMAPGSYDLVASAPAAGGRLAAHTPIDIGGADIDNVSLTLQIQLTMSGRITVENMQAGVTAPMNGIRVELRREPFTPELLVLLPTVSADGTFSLSGVTPGDYQIKVGLAGFRGYIKSARYGAVDALNPPFHIDVAGQLEIVISPDAGSLDGIVLDDMQKPFPDATVVLVPDPPRRQRFDLFYAAGSDASGRLHLDSVAPGDYRMFAWDDVPADAWQDPDFLRQYEDRGKPVRISEGTKQILELRLIPRR